MTFHIKEGQGQRLEGALALFNPASSATDILILESSDFLLTGAQQPVRGSWGKQVASGYGLFILGPAFGTEPLSLLSHALCLPVDPHWILRDTETCGDTSSCHRNSRIVISPFWDDTIFGAGTYCHSFSQ